MSHWENIISSLIKYISFLPIKYSRCWKLTHSWLRICSWSMWYTFNIAIIFWHLDILLFFLFCFQGFLLTTIIKPVRLTTIALFLISSFWVILFYLLMICCWSVVLSHCEMLVFKQLRKHAKKKLRVNDKEIAILCKFWPWSFSESFVPME